MGYRLDDREDECVKIRYDLCCQSFSCQEEELMGEALREEAVEEVDKRKDSEAETGGGNERSSTRSQTQQDEQCGET